MRNFSFLIVLFGAALLAPGGALAKDEEVCIYQDRDRTIKQVNSRSAVPPEFREAARCFAAKKNSGYLADPGDIKLTGTVRKEEMVSSIGRISLRWPRKVETLFGRTPQRAMADAATTTSRALKASGFPPTLRILNQEWSVVFLDEDMPEAQIPRSLISNCHPAWMTPPANIYVVAQRAAAGCGGGKVTSQAADAELTHILLHEIGHAVEHELLKNNHSYDRLRGEGFASWFEQYASDYSSIIKRGAMREYYFRLAKQAIAENPVFTFSGSAYDYARASLFFHAIVERRGVRGLMQVYEIMAKDRIPFFTAVEKATGWDQKRLGQEVAKLVQ